MKKHLPSILPALALLTLGGCAVSSTLATTENDGMYYSAADDKVTALAVPVAQAAPVGDPNDVINPDYNGSVAESGSAEYYDDERYAAAPQRRNNYRGGSLGYYSFPYADPYFYGASAFGYSPYSAFGHSPYAFYDPFYRPFYGYGGLTINIGFGFGRPYYRPFGYSPYGFYDPYYAYGGYGGYGRPWGNHYGYGNGYYGNGFYNNGYYGVGSDRPARNVTYGPRRSRTGTGAGLADGSTSTGSNASPGRSRVVQEGRFATPGNSGATVPAGQYNGRSRVRDVTAGNGNSSASGQPAATSGAATRSGRYRDAQPVQGASTTASQPAGTTRRWRVLDNSASNGAPASGNGRTTPGSVSQPERARRATYYSGDNGSNSGSGTAQPQRQRSFERSSSPSRTSEPSRSYSQPSRASEPSRSYSQPSRASEPSRSYSQPSRSSSPAQSSGGSDGGGRGRVR